KPLCAGQYLVSEHQTEKLVLVRNPRYWATAAVMPKLEIRTVRDQSARTMMLAGGSADLVQNAIRVDLVGEVGGRKRLRIDSGPGAILTYLMMNNTHPVLKDARVRRAIAHAVDRKNIVDAKFEGRAILATGMLPTAHWAYEGGVECYPYDPALARKLLDEAGYPDPDGDGPKPRLKMTYKTSANQFRLTLARIISAQLGEVGIEVEVRSFEFGTFFSDIKDGNFELASMQTAAITEPDYLYSYFHSSRIPSNKDRNAGNRWRYRSDELDALVARGRTEMAREVRAGLYSEAQKVLARDLPIIPLWHEDVIAISNVDVSGYKVLPSARFAGLATASKKKRGIE
ncbi:MAG: ABC transporter substrate-binding protein, partial [Deltaproteobacteria bacterium]|nr:ABC transporter substrate-binding protein [Deltaproteobacteria bacterium]